MRCKPRASWSEKEDEILRQAVEEYGTSLWTKVAERLKDRTNKQCRERWLNHLCPQVNKAPWSKAEDELILSFVKKHGSKWATIAKRLEGRPDNAVKKRFQVLERRGLVDFQVNRNPRKNFYTSSPHNSLDPATNGKRDFNPSQVHDDGDDDDAEDHDSEDEDRDDPRLQQRGNMSVLNPTFSRLAEKPELLRNQTQELLPVIPRRSMCDQQTQTSDSEMPATVAAETQSTTLISFPTTLGKHRLAPPDRPRVQPVQTIPTPSPVSSHVVNMAKKSMPTSSQAALPSLRSLLSMPESDFDAAKLLISPEEDEPTLIHPRPMVNLHSMSFKQIVQPHAFPMIPTQESDQKAVLINDFNDDEWNNQRFAAPRPLNRPGLGHRESGVSFPRNPAPSPISNAAMYLRMDADEDDYDEVGSRAVEAEQRPTSVVTTTNNTVSSMPQRARQQPVLSQPESFVSSLPSRPPEVSYNHHSYNNNNNNNNTKTSSTSTSTSTSTPYRLEPSAPQPLHMSTMSSSSNMAINPSASKSLSHLLDALRTSSQIPTNKQDQIPDRDTGDSFHSVFRMARHQQEQQAHPPLVDRPSYERVMQLSNQEQYRQQLHMQQRMEEQQRHRQQPYPYYR